MARAGELGVDQALSFLKEVDAINLRRRARMVDLGPRAAATASFARQPRRRARARRSSPTPTTSATRPALDVAARSSCRAPQVQRLRPRRRWTTRARRYPTLAYADRALEAAPGRRRRAAPDRVAGVPRPRPGRGSTSVVGATRASSTAATRSTRTPGAPPAGPTGPSAGPEPALTTTYQHDPVPAVR